MRVWKYLLATLFPLFAVGIITAQTARADEASYLYQLRYVDGISGTNLELLKAGYAVCADIAAGIPMGTSVDSLYLNSQLNGRADAAFLYQTASDLLC